jgi:hypothetical protein
LLRKPALRALAKEGLKLALCVLLAFLAVAAVRRSRGETWLRPESHELLGGLIAIVAIWLVSAARTISASYREFSNTDENR